MNDVGTRWYTSTADPAGPINCAPGRPRSEFSRTPFTASIVKACNVPAREPVFGRKIIMSDDAKQRPVVSKRFDRVDAAIWSREWEDGSRSYEVTFSRSHKNGDRRMEADVFLPQT